MAVTAGFAALASACLVDVDYGGTAYRCPDGRTCAAGFTCVAGVCREDGAGLDGGLPDGDAGPLPGALVDVPGGAFLRGCDIALEMNCPFDALPARMITLAAFAIEKTEVSQRAYAACVAAGPCPMPAGNFDPAGKPDHPVRGVSWDDANAYCAFVGRRLPSEAEWERAARGIDGRTYPWGSATPSCARVNYSACSGMTEAVGAHPDNASPVGALDLAGNVAEWVADRYSATYYAIAPDRDPPGPVIGNERIVRGGGFATASGTLRTWARGKAPPGTLAPGTGFRCAK